jgi:hypothetical protein
MESWCLFVLIFEGVSLFILASPTREMILSNKFQPMVLLQKSADTINFFTMFLLSLDTECIQIQAGTNLLTTNILRLPNLEDFIGV